MEVQSAMSSGIEGFQKATAVVDESAKAILAQTTTENAPSDNSISVVLSNESADASMTDTSAHASSTSSPSEVTDLNQSLVNLKVAEYQAKASVQIIKSADESLGTLLDVTA